MGNHNKLRNAVDITLVPGTWHWLTLNRKDRWFDDRSRFYRKFCRTLDQTDFSYSIYVQSWSGANSIVERAKTAALLARSIAKRRRKDEHTIQFVIGHSHGGTIAMFLSRYLSPRLMPHLITMATPFIELAPENLTKKNLRGMFMLILCLALVILQNSGVISVNNIPVPIVLSGFELKIGLAVFISLAVIFLFSLFGSFKIQRLSFGGLTMKSG